MDNKEFNAILQQTEKLPFDLKQLLADKAVFISAAESCTGGLVSRLITEAAGSSIYFKGGAVTYCDEAKIHLLKVKPKTLEEHTAVSYECAKEMAQGALKEFNADYAVSTTGFAGPDAGTMANPRGTVYFGLAVKGKETKLFRQLFEGNRTEVRILAARFILTELIKELKSR